LFLPDRKAGWNTDIILIRNAPIGQRFIEYIWELRLFCPSCVAEQCAANLALRDLLLFQANKAIAMGHAEQLWSRAQRVTYGRPYLQVRRDQHQVTNYFSIFNRIVHICFGSNNPKTTPH